MGIQVKWNEIYGRSSTTTYNFNYELACVLFNIAALHTQKAMNYIDVATTEPNHV